MERVIYNIEELDAISKEVINKTNRAVVATAFKVRDLAQQDFTSKAKSTYKYVTPNIEHLASGIAVGKLRGGQIKVHALGFKSDYDSYKTRFFVGGTTHRTQTKYRGQTLSKPFTKGYIKAMDNLTNVEGQAQQILEQYINNAIKNGK